MKNHALRSVFCILLTFVAVTGFSQTREDRSVGSFQSISLSISADVILTQGSPVSVALEADENDLENIVTDVRNGVLVIKRDPLWKRNLKNVTIWITAPEIEGLTLSGSGSILAEQALASEELEIRVSGSGKIDLRNLNGEELDVAISGSGTVYLGGNADEMGVSISGSGGIMAQSFQVSECSVRISGSGRCNINALDELDAMISGSGRVTYFNNPQVDARVSGSGRVVKGSD